MKNSEKIPVVGVQGMRLAISKAEPNQMPKPTCGTGVFAFSTSLTARGPALTLVANMKNVAVIVGLLVGASGAAKLIDADTNTAGRIGMAVVFTFTAFGHFVKRDEMAAMIPPSMPSRAAIVILSGVFEALLAILLLMPSYSRMAGIAVCVFLMLVTPVNVYAALKRVDFGGHAAGPSYLLVRLPLQAML